MLSSFVILCSSALCYLSYHKSAKPHSYLKVIGLSAMFSVLMTTYGVVGVSVTFSAEPGPSSVVSIIKVSGVS